MSIALLVSEDFIYCNKSRPSLKQRVPPGPPGSVTAAYGVPQVLQKCSQAKCSLSHSPSALSASDMKGVLYDMLQLCCLYHTRQAHAYYVTQYMERDKIR